MNKIYYSFQEWADDHQDELCDEPIQDILMMAWRDATASIQQQVKELREENERLKHELNCSREA